MKMHTKKLKTILTDDLTNGYEFSTPAPYIAPRPQILQSLPIVPRVKQKEQVPVSAPVSNLLSNRTNQPEQANRKPHNVVSDEVNSLLHKPPLGLGFKRPQNLEGTILTGLVKEVFTGEKTKQRIAEQNEFNRQEKELQKLEQKEIARKMEERREINQKAVERQEMERKETEQQKANPLKEMPPKQLSPNKLSQEELWYPASFAQRKKEQEEKAWIEANPNASTAELFYPSMRKKDVPQAVAEQEKSLSKISAEQGRQLEANTNMKPQISHHNDSTELNYDDMARENETKQRQKLEQRKEAERDQVTKSQEFYYGQLDEYETKRQLKLEMQKQEKQKEERGKQKQNQLKNGKETYDDVKRRFPYNKLTPEQQEDLFGINPLGDFHRRNDFPLNKLNLEQQDEWLYPEGKREGVEQVIGINSLVQERYASIDSTARRAEKFEAEFPILFQHIGDKNAQTIIIDIQKKNGNSDIPSSTSWRVMERNLDGQKRAVTFPKLSDLNLDYIHQHFVAKNGNDIGYSKGETDGAIMKDHLLSQMRANKEYEGIVLHDTYLQASVDMLKSKYGEDTYNLIFNNCQDFIDDAIHLGNDIARLFGDTVYIKKPQ